jgi:glutaredoxin
MGVGSRYELLTRSECHLCDEMKVVLDRVFGELGVEYESVDVDCDELLIERYGETVPVLLRDGRAVAKVRLTDRQARRIVRRRRLWRS